MINEKEQSIDEMVDNIMNDITDDTSLCIIRCALTRYFESNEELIKAHGCSCKYCGEPNGSQDRDILCKECRETFGHEFYSEL